MRVFKMVDKVADSRLHDPDLRRERHRQGADRPRDPLPQPKRASGPFVSHQLRRASRATCSSRNLFGHVKGSFTGAVRDQAGLFTGGRGRHVLPRRGGRDAARDPGEAAARAAGAGDHPGRRHQADQDRLPARRRHQRRPRDARWRRAASAPTSTTASTSSRSGCRSLRERRDDIPLLVDHFLKRKRRRRGAQGVIARRRWSSLMKYDWPGNVRELENVIERAVILDEGGVDRRPRTCRSKIRFGEQPAREPGDRLADPDARGAGAGVHPQGARTTPAGRRSGPRRSWASTPRRSIGSSRPIRWKERCPATAPPTSSACAPTPIWTTRAATTPNGKRR